VGYNPVAHFLNPFSLDTTRYCEEEEGYHLIDPVTIPEDFSPGDGIIPVPGFNDLYQEYEYKCTCSNGYMLSKDKSECLPCHEIHDQCTQCELVGTASVPTCT